MTDAAQSGASADAVKDEGTAAGNGVIVPEQVPAAPAAAPAMPPVPPPAAAPVPAAPARPMAQAPGSPPSTIVRRRPRRTPSFSPAPSGRGTVVDRKDLLVRTRDTTGAPKLSSDRPIAGNLPAWSPLPPNETIVRRRPSPSTAS